MTPRKDKRNQEIVELKDKMNLSFSQIGEQYKISRQAAHAIYRREKNRN